MKVFVDANIFIDIFNADRPMHRFSVATYEYLLKTRSEIFTSCDLITTIYYIESKRDKLQALLNIQNMIKTLKIIDFSNTVIEEVCELMLNYKNYKDFEDALQYVLAKKEKCDLIISNDNDFYSPDILTLSSKDFYEKYCKQ